MRVITHLIMRARLRTIPSIRLRIAGKSIPVEKFCERKALRYLRQGRLYFPHYEFLYFWNGFSILENNAALVKSIFDDVDNLWERMPSEDTDDEALYYFLKGVCHKALRENFRAEKCFLKVIERCVLANSFRSYSPFDTHSFREKSLAEFTYLPPNACFELALVMNDLDRKEEMEQLLVRARTYRSYPLETKLHFRIHGVMEMLAEGRIAPSVQENGKIH